MVTKGHPIETVHQAVAAGIRLLGENYVEEALEKMQTLASQAIGSPGELEWHMIGHLQSRKARLVCQHFACLHSLDSLKLAERLDRFAAELGRKLPVLLECNVSGEQTKFGYPVWREDTWHEFCRGILPPAGVAAFASAWADDHGAVFRSAGAGQTIFPAPAPISGFFGKKFAPARIGLSFRWA